MSEPSRRFLWVISDQGRGGRKENCLASRDCPVPDDLNFRKVRWVGAGGELHGFGWLGWSSCRLRVAGVGPADDWLWVRGGLNLASGRGAGAFPALNGFKGQRSDQIWVVAVGAAELPELLFEEHILGAEGFDLEAQSINAG
jgi:hypothetical protein